MNALKSLRFIRVVFFKEFDTGAGLKKKGVSNNKDLIR